MTPNGQLPGFISWSRLTREQFDALVEALLSRIYSDDSLWKVDVFRGDGGDGGRDVVVTSVSDHAVRIFQLKFFPGGFSSTHGKRRNQIKKSFKSAMSHSPTEWTLVVPENTTPDEKTFLAKLKQFTPTPLRDTLKISEFTAVNLNDELAKHPDLRQSFEHNDWRDFAAAFNIPSEILPSTPDEVGLRFRKAQEAVDAADPDWTWVPTYEKGVPGRLLVAKTSRSPVVSPISIEIHTNSTTVTPELEQKLEELFGYGLDGDVDLSPEVVERFSVSGPPIVAREEQGVRVLISRLTAPSASFDGVDIEMRNTNMELLWSHDAEVEHAAAGTSGYSMRLRINKALKLVFKVPNSPDSAVSVDVRANFESASLTEIMDACTFLLRNSEAASMLIRLKAADKESSFHLGELAGGSGVGIESLDQIQYMFELANDLDVVQRKLRMRFKVPERMSQIDRAMIRALRLMFEGHRTSLPIMSDYPVKISSDHRNDEPIRRMLSGEQLSIWATTDLFEFEMLGRKFVVPNVTVGGTRMMLAGHEQIGQQLTKSRSVVKEVSGRLVPARGGFLSAIARDFVRDEHAPLFLTPWSLPDFKEPGLPEFDDPSSLPPGLSSPEVDSVSIVARSL